MAGRLPNGCRRAWVCLALGLALSACRSAPKPGLPAGAWRPPSDGLARPEGFPEMGKWMYDAQGLPAHWLGERYRGKVLVEPINLLLLDTQSRSADEAKQRVEEALAAAGYPVRSGHSTGYQGYLGGAIYTQLPDGKHAAFASHPFEVPNNHGRLFGPHPTRDGWLFIGAFSREGVEPLDRVKHRYVSFNRARDHVAQQLDERSAFKLRAFLKLDNTLLGDATRTTGDHDGVAVFLSTASR